MHAWSCMYVRVNDIYLSIYLSVCLSIYLYRHFIVKMKIQFHTDRQMDK